MKEYQKNYSVTPASKARRRNYLLKRSYGITQSEYENMLTKQGGRCAVCRTDNAGKRGKFHVDHCHVTGIVRKLLCSNCNTCLGRAKDDPEILEALASYVREFIKFQKVA